MSFDIKDWWHDFLISVGVEECPICDGTGLYRNNYKINNKCVIRKSPCFRCPVGRRMRRKLTGDVNVANTEKTC